MNQVQVREMARGEEKQVLAIGRRAFDGFERLWISRPRLALVAVVEETIVGAVLYKLQQAGGKKVGYVDYAFIDPAHDGKGYGGVLYREAVAHLWRLGVDAQTALVKDDNVGSWHLFEKNGFHIASLLELVKCFGLGGALSQYFGSPFCVGVGMRLYLAVGDGDQQADQRHTTEKGSGLIHLAVFFIVNALLMIIGKSIWGSMAWMTSLALVLTLGITLLGAYLGTRFSTSRKWSFRFNNGGLLICAVISVFSALPMIGRFYPDRYEKTKPFHRDMGIVSLLTWGFLLVMTLVCQVLFQNADLPANMAMIGSLLLAYHCLPLYPFESFGGRRVFQWNKPVFGLMVLLSTATAALVWFQ